MSAHVGVVHLDASGVVKSFGWMLEEAVATQQANVTGETVEVLPEEEMAKIVPGRRWRVDAGVVSEVTTVTADELAQRRDAALRLVDLQAENARLRLLTPGAGQMLEYAATKADAVAALAAADPLDPSVYPWLAAEQDALAGVGQTKTLREVAQSVIQVESAWIAAGVQIKQIRRETKMKLELAASASAIDEIMASLAWPSA